MRLILIRHAESEHARRGVIADVRGCTGLTDRGIEQARGLAHHLTLPESMEQRRRRAGHRGLDRYDALLSSPVLRARQTADALAAVLPGLRMEEDEGLCEVRPGEADGLTWEAYRSRYGAFDLVAEPDRPFSPGGESWNAFTTRVRATLDRLAHQFDGGTVVAVTHAGFIVASVLVAFGIPRPGTRARLDPRHTSLTEWRFADGIWQLERYNDVCHLGTESWPGVVLAPPDR